MRWRRLVCALGLVGCGAGSGAEETGSCAATFSSFDDEPDDPSLQPPTPPSLAVPELGVAFRMYFPAHANAGDGRSLWLSEDEAFAATLDVALGTALQADHDCFVALFVDGQLMPESTMSRHIKRGEIGRFEFSLAADQLTVGAHSATFVTWAENGSQLIGGGDLTIYKGSIDFAEAGPVEADVAPDDSGLSTIVFRKGSNKLLKDEGRAALTEDGALSLTAFVRPAGQNGCVDALFQQALIGLLDGKQIELGDLGLHPAVELHEAESALFDFNVRGLPLDGMPHILQFWILTSHLQSVESPDGSFAPWADYSRQVGQLSW